MLEYLTKSLGFGLIEWVTTFNNLFDNQFAQDIKTNRWSSIIVKSGLFCVVWCFGIRYSVCRIEMLSLICSCFTGRHSITMSTVVTLPSILSLMNDLLPMIPNIWRFSAVPLACWCWHSWLTWGTWRWRQIDRWWCWRWRAWQITYYRVRTMDFRLSYELLFVWHCQGRW